MGILLPGAARSLWALDRKGRVARGAAQRVATPVRLGRFAAGSFGLFVWVGVIGAVGVSFLTAV